ncbi:MAG TPA: DUF4190 domain-containing protein [Actinomycetes bacterium]|nr:DUF4190 domain-containing protein [Actinomycetes bacterium]
MTTPPPEPPADQGGGQYPPPPPPPPPPGMPVGPGGAAAVPQQNQKALISMILGILSLFCCGIIAGVGAIILSTMAKKEIEASGGLQSGAGMAKAGLILGIIGVVLSVVWIPFYFNNF